MKWKWFKKKLPSELDIIEVLISKGTTGFDIETGERNTIQVDASQAKLDAEMMRQSSHFLKALQELRDKYLQHMRRADPRDPSYPDYVARLQGIEELVKKLLAPIASD